MHQDDTSRATPPGLNDSYDFLSELRRGSASTTWLAYDRETHRDVVITHVRADAGLPRETLAQVGADAQVLAAHRHPGIVPVLASHWLHDGSLAIVRPRVRGTTLRQSLQTTGALPLDRAALLLREVEESLDWACRVGVVHRAVTAESVCLQTGAQRLLLSFGPALAPDAQADALMADSSEGPSVNDAVFEPLRTRCADTATLGRLAWELLTTRPVPPEGVAGAMTRRGYREPGLADLRPDLPLSVAAEVESALRCERDAPRGPLAFVSTLAATAGLTDAAESQAAGEQRPARSPDDVPAPVQPRRTPGVGRWSEAPTERVASPHEDQRGMKGVMAFTVIAVVLLVATVLYINRERTYRREVARRTNSSSGVSAGDVIFDTKRVDTSGLVTPRAARATSRGPQAAAPRAARSGAGTNARTVFTPPGTSAPVLRADSPSLPDPAPSGDPCASTANADQQRCLQIRLGDEDVELNDTYRELVRELRSDPAAVAELRGKQREWLNRRDEECRGGVQPGITWAPSVAECLANRSAARTRELRIELARKKAGL